MRALMCVSVCQWIKSRSRTWFFLRWGRNRSYNLLGVFFSIFLNHCYSKELVSKDECFDREEGNEKKTSTGPTKGEKKKSRVEESCGFCNSFRTVIKTTTWPPLQQREKTVIEKPSESWLPLLLLRFIQLLMVARLSSSCSPDPPRRLLLFYLFSSPLFECVAPARELYNCLFIFPFYQIDRRF